MSSFITEEEIEQNMLERLEQHGWEVRSGAEIAPGSGERQNWEELILQETLIAALVRLNPDVPQNYLRQAMAEVNAPQSQDPLAENHRIHRILVDGYKGVSYTDPDGVLQNPTIRFLSANPEHNVFHAINQVTVRSREHERRFDVVLYVNGMPLSFVEVKRGGDDTADASVAYDQLRVYLRELPLAFRYSVFVLATDDADAQYGTIFTPWNHFAPWNVDDDGRPIDPSELVIDGIPTSALDLAVDGLYNQERLLQLIRDFTAFDSTEEGLTKRIAKPHQYFAVAKAVGCTLRAVEGNGRIGVVWHTQGSGKSMEMELYAAKVMRDPRLKNPTILVLTDRTELDTQLFETFAASTLLPEDPKNMGSRAELREALSQAASGGILFSTLHKFGLTQEEREAKRDHPVLSERSNIIVMVDEAHRSHYDDLDGFAAHLKNALPHASHIAFTGTPIAEGERDTRKVFGADIDVYDLRRAVQDGATVPVYFEPRLIPLAKIQGIDAETLDDAAEELTRDLDDTEKARIQQRAAALETVYGAPQRLQRLAQDLVRHWEDRRESMHSQIGVPGKAMVVCATRVVAARLYEQIAALRPDWATDDDRTGKVKVIYSGTPGEGGEVAPHLRRPSQNRALQERLKDPEDELEIAIVQSKLLTGFDSPPLHTLYVDRPLRGALLMQALARVNRTFREKDAGLLVAYAPITENLQQALQEFTTDAEAAGQKVVGRDVDEAFALAQGFLSQLDALVRPVPWREILNSGTPRAKRDALQSLVNHLRSPHTPGNTDPEHPSRRPVADDFRDKAGRLARAWALAQGHQDREELRLPVAVYEDVRTWLAKIEARERAARGEPVPEEIRLQLGLLVEDYAHAQEVLNIYEEAGLPTPSLHDLDPQWLEEASAPDKAEAAIDALRTQLLEESRRATHGNDVRARQFSERVDEVMRKYTNLQLTSAEVLRELAEMAKQVSEEARRGERFSPPLRQEELIFYDVIAQDESALEDMGDDKLAQIAREVVQVVRRDTRVDWTVRDDVRAKLRTTVRRLLRKHGYPPSQQPEALKKVIQAMERMAPRMAQQEGGAAQ